jgi:alpha-tubulin suppressor-like RCC1 family protein
MRKLGNVLGLLLLVGCGGSSSQPPPNHVPTGTNIDPSVSAPLANNLQQAATESGSQSAVAAQGATLALQAGVQASSVNITAAPTPPPQSAVPTRSGDVATGAAQAYAFQLTLLHVPTGPSTQVFSGVLVFTDAANAALAAGPSPGSPIPPGVGLILTGGNALWTATGGQVSAQVGQVLSASCPHASALPAFVTACTLNDFSNAGFAITASTPSSSYATGSKTVSLPAGALVGAALTVDCSQTSLCGTSSSTVSISLSPLTPTVQTGGSVQFTATVTGTSNTAVTWTAPSYGGGTISSTGLYTAPAASGTYTVVATSVADTSASQSTTVTVTSGPVVSVSISPSTVTVPASGTQQFTATVAGSSNTQVTWSVEEGTSGGVVSASGLYTAPGTGGTYHVVATSVADTTKTAVATVTVAAASLPWVMVTAGSDNSMGLRTDGSLWTWGGNYAGELGNGAALGTFQTSPVQLSGSGYAYVAAGQTFDLAITSGGTLYAWGRNTFGQLGIGNTTNASVPTVVGAGFASVTGGYLHSVGIKTDGTLWAWGDNTYGELGDGTTTSSTSPIQVGTDTNWASVSAGYFYTLALKTDGTLWAWGDTIEGQLGIGTYTSSTQATPVQIGTGYASVTATWFSSYAVKTDGTLWGWGYNLAGGLGSPPTPPDYFLSPIQIGTGYVYGTGATQTSFGMGLKTDGTVWASGSNTNGNFGNGTRTSTTAFVQTQSGFASIQVGSIYVLGLKPDGTLWAWGDNTYGELGIGSAATPVLSPVRVP